MSTTVTFRLNSRANSFQAGESTGFGIRGGVRYYDRETKQNEYTNYECVVFAKKPAQIEFYLNALIEGAIVEATGQQLKIRSFEGQSGTSLSIELLNANLGFIGQSQPKQPQQAPQQNYQQPPPQQQPQQSYQQQAPQQQSYQQPPQQQAPQGHNQGVQQPQQLPGNDDFDDDIPF